MSKIICANCGRKSDIGHYDYKKKTGETVAVIFLCDTCRMLMKSVDLSFTIDDEKIQTIKKTMKLNKERIEEKTEENKT